MVPPYDVLVVPAQLLSIRQLQNFNACYFRSILCSSSHAIKQCRGAPDEVLS